MHDKYVHVVIDTMSYPKNQTNSLLAYYKHLKLKKLGGRGEMCGTEDIRVKFNAVNTVFDGNCGPEAIQVWLPALPCSGKELIVNLVNPRNSKFTSTIIE